MALSRLPLRLPMTAGLDSLHWHVMVRCDVDSMTLPHIDGVPLKRACDRQLRSRLHESMDLLESNQLLCSRVGCRKAFCILAWESDSTVSN